MLGTLLNFDYCTLNQVLEGNLVPYIGLCIIPIASVILKRTIELTKIWIIAGIITWLYNVLFLIKYYNDCDTCILWNDIWTNLAARTWTVDYIGVYFVVIVFFFIEGYRYPYGTATPHGFKKKQLYWYTFICLIGGLYIALPAFLLKWLYASVETPRALPKKMPPAWSIYAVIASVQFFFWGQLFFLEWLEDHCWVGSLGPATVTTKAGVQLVWQLSLIMNAWLTAAVYPENRYKDGIKSWIFTTCTFHDVAIGMCVFLIKREQKIKDIEREKKDDSNDGAGPSVRREAGTNKLPVGSAPLPSLIKSRGFEGGEPLTAEPHKYLTLAEITSGIKGPERTDRWAMTAGFLAVYLTTWTWSASISNILSFDWPAAFFVWFVVIGITTAANDQSRFLFGNFGFWIRENRLNSFFLVVTSLITTGLSLNWNENASFSASTVGVMLHFFSWRFIVKPAAQALLIVMTIFIIKLFFDPYGSPPIPRWLKVVLLVPFVLAFAPAMFSYWHPCSLQPGVEYPHLGENPSFCSINTGFKSFIYAKSTDGTDTATRGAHAKGTSCLRGEFIVNDWVAHRFQHGVFQPGARYPVYIRTSNGDSNIQSDTESDVRGLAFKLMGVQGPKLLNGSDEEKFTQDFNMITSPHFNMKDVDTYDRGVRELFKSPADFVFWTLYTAQWKIFGDTLKMFSDGHIANPLTAKYYSGSPYRLGAGTSLAVKYGLFPCNHTINATLDDIDMQKYYEAKSKGYDDYLTEAVRRRLDDTYMCFDFSIQEQRDPCRDPIEKSTTVWRGHWTQIAQLRIPRQTFALRDQMKFCDDASFNPWHGLPDHQPLGGINRARRSAYETSVAERRRINKVVAIEPTGKEIFTGPPIVSKYSGAGELDIYEFARYGAPFQNLPRLIKNFPFREQFDRSAQSQFMSRVWHQFKGHTNRQEAAFSKYSKPQDFQNLLNDPNITTSYAYPQNNIVQTWQEDYTFGWQYIRGVNPVMITLASSLSSLPKVLRLDAAAKQRIAEIIAPATLESLASSSRLYYADYDMLVGTYTMTARVLYSPVVVLWLDAQRNLMPLVIQLSRSENQPELYLPVRANATELEKRVWLYAKMCASSSDGLHHEMVTHLGLTHIISEGIILAVHRQFAKSHPMYQLLEHHMQFTLAINQLGRNSLLRPKDAFFDLFFSTGLRGCLQLMEEAYTRYYNFTKYLLPNELASRGFKEIPVEDQGTARDPLPGYYYRDDAYRVWNALHKYFVEAINAIYPESDAQMLADPQLTGWLRELVDVDGAALPGFPVITKRTELAKAVAGMVFTMSAQHAAVNFGQFDFYGFIPNRPLVLLKPMPSDKNALTDLYIVKSLPSFWQSQEIVALMWFLQLPPMEQLAPENRGRGKLTLTKEAPATLGLHPPDKMPELFREPWRRMQAELDVVQQQIVARQTRTGHYYPYLEPHSIPVSISI